MAKKLNLENTAKKVEGLANTVNIIAQNRLIISFFLIVDGITFILNPNNTLSEMAKNIILLALFAAFTVFITNLAAKPRNIKTIILSLIVIVVGIIFYIYPDFIAAYIQLLLSLFVIYDGVANLANALHLSKLTHLTDSIKGKLSKTPTKAKKASDERFKEVDQSINQGLEEQKAKLMTPLKNIVNKTSRFSALFIAINVLSIILGVILLIFPDVSMSVWGLIFLYTGTSNLIVTAKTMHLMSKIKERKLKEIFLEDSGDKSKTSSSSKKQK